MKTAETLQKTSTTRLPKWKVVVFSLTPALLLFAMIEIAARIEWHMLGVEAYQKDVNKTINFIHVPDPVLGYRLVPNFDQSEHIATRSLGHHKYEFPVHFHTNANGYMQREDVAPIKRKDSLRIVAIGESTTQGFHVDQNYPSVLQKLIKGATNYPGGVEMVNAGVQGYLSDQWALLTEGELAGLEPDIVVLYVGWNDFQVYDLHGEAPKKSNFSDPLIFWPSEWFKSVTLLNAALQKMNSKLKVSIRETNAAELSNSAAPTETDSLKSFYKIYLRNLDRAVNAFRKGDKKPTIVISTLVGRWPYESEEEFATSDGSTWWMKGTKSADNSQIAVQYLDQFNDLIREYAKQNGLVLVDSAASFKNVKREEIMFDFCHFNDVGYRMLAETIFEGLRNGGVIQASELVRDPAP